MLKRYTFWLKTAVIFQLLTGIIHSLSLFISPTPENETERQLFALMSTHKIDMGAGFHQPFQNLVTALSSCFTFLCIFATLINGYLLWKHIGPDVMKGIIGINVVIFGMLFAVMSYLTFLPPIVCSGLIFVSLLVAFMVVPKRETGV